MAELVSRRQFIHLVQEPMTLSGQLPSIRVTAFSQTKVQAIG